MGGRSSSFKSKAGGGQKLMDQDEYLARKGVEHFNWADDKIRSNRMKTTQSGEERFHKQYNQAEVKYTANRNKAISEYNELVKSGKVRARTQPEKIFRSAQGHPDNRSTQAARRMLAKHGVDWQTGKRIKGFTGHGYPEIDPKTGMELRSKNKRR
jgi:hypothetical protein